MQSITDSRKESHLESEVVSLHEARESRAFWGVMISFLVHGLVVSTWVSRIATLKTTLHMSDGALGLALLGTAIGSVTAIPICGALVVRFGAKRAATWTSIGFCLVLALPAFATGTWTLFTALLAYGAMAGANDVAMNAQAVGTEKFLGRPTISKFHAMFSLGGIIGAALGGFIASRGILPLEHLGVGGLVCLVFAIWMSRLTIQNPASSGTGGRASLRRIPVALAALSVIGFCIFLSEGAIADWTAVYLKQVLGASDGLAPVGYAVFSAAMALFRFFGDAITVRLGRAWTIRAGALVAACGLAFVVWVHSPYQALAGFAAVGAGFSSIIPLVFAAGGRIPSMSEGAGVAAVSGTGYLGFLVGPPAIGFISEATSLRGGLFLLVVLSLLAAMLVTAVERSGRDGNPFADQPPVGD